MNQVQIYDSDRFIDFLVMLDNQCLGLIYEHGDYLFRSKAENTLQFWPNTSNLYSRVLCTHNWTCWKIYNKIFSLKLGALPSTTEML